jgi:hypothetical protein
MSRSARFCTRLFKRILKRSELLPKKNWVAIYRSTYFGKWRLIFGAASWPMVLLGFGVRRANWSG